MEAEAFPIRFTRGVRAYWRRRKYHRLVEAADGGKATRQLGAADARQAPARHVMRCSPEKGMHALLARSEADLCTLFPLARSDSENLKFSERR